MTAHESPHGWWRETTSRVMLSKSALVVLELARCRQLGEAEGEAGLACKVLTLTSLTPEMFTAVMTSM